MYVKLSRLLLKHEKNTFLPYLLICWKGKHANYGVFSEMTLKLHTDMVMLMVNNALHMCRIHVMFSSDWGYCMVHKTVRFGICSWAKLIQNNNICAFKYGLVCSKPESGSQEYNTNQNKH